MKNVLVVLSGPSGVGKGTIAKKLIKRNKDFFLSVSCTTRSPRQGEVNAKDYFFISKPEFKERIENGGFFMPKTEENKYHVCRCSRREHDSATLF